MDTELLINELRERRDSAYLQCIDQLRKDVCRGAEYKMKTGTFGMNELDTHCLARELLGRHRAFNDVIKLLTEQ